MLFLLFTKNVYIKWRNNYSATFFVGAWHVWQKNLDIFHFIFFKILTIRYSLSHYFGMIKQLKKKSIEKMLNMAGTDMILGLHL